MNNQNLDLNQTYFNLSQDVKDFIQSDQVSNDLNEIIRAWKITDIPNFFDYVLQVIIGSLQVEDFSHILQNQFSLNEEDTNELIYDLHALILNDAWQIGSETNGVNSKSEDYNLIEPVIESYKPDQVYTLDLEIPPQNLPMVESKEEHDKLVENLEKNTPIGTIPTVNHKAQSALILKSMLEMRRSTSPEPASPLTTPIQKQQEPTSPQFQNPLLEKYFNQTDPVGNEAGSQQQPPITQSDSHFPPKEVSKFSYHVHDPYREEPEP